MGHRIFVTSLVTHIANKLTLPVANYVYTEAYQQIVMQTKLKDIFDKTLKPTLKKLGFERIQLKSCIHPEELWRNGRLWFAASFDWRDQYLEVSLGHLYWFRDVMPRVIVLGDFSSYVKFDPYDQFKRDGLDKTLIEIQESFDHALGVYRSRYPEILHARLHPKKSKYIKEYLLALGEEVTDEELKEYIA